MKEIFHKVFRVALIAVCDFQTKPLGGEVSLLRNMLQEASSGYDIEYSLIGISFDASDQEGTWQSLKIGTETYPWFPAFVSSKEKEKTRVPLRLRLVHGLRKYYRSVSLSSFDAVYIHSPELVLALKKTNIPIFYHVHGNPLLTLRGSRFSLFRKAPFVDLYDRIIQKVLVRSVGIIWAAAASKEAYYHSLNNSVCKELDKKSTVIHSSVDPLLIPQSPSSFDFDNDTTYIVTVSRLSSVKHIDFLLEVFNKLSQQYSKKLHFLICGEGEEGERLRSLSNNLNINNRVSFLGNLSKGSLASILTHSSLFLFASESEAMSLVVLESLAMGTPVVSTNVGDISLVINEHTGALIAQRDVHTFVEASLRCLEYGRSHFERACKQQGEQYSPKRMRDGIDNFILTCLEGIR